MRLYHGSYVEISHPETSKGRAKVDFGQGFYLTSVQTQAEKWARIIAFRKGPAFCPIVNVFELGDELFSQSEFCIKSFKKYDVEWLQYVVDCRRGGRLQLLYDLVEGGVANFALLHLMNYKL